MSHPYSFCLLSLPGETGFIFLLDNGEGLDDSHNFVFAPFNAIETEVRFTRPEAYRFNSVDEYIGFSRYGYPICHSEIADSEISREQYIENVKLARASFNADFQKVIMSRNKVIDTPEGFGCIVFFERLAEAHPDKFCYIFSSHESGTWMGASPELLLSQKNTSVRTMSLAGTKGNHSTEWSKKEMDEQAIVTKFIVSELESLGSEKVSLDNPHIVQAGPVTHLRTNLSAKLKSQVEPAIVAKKLHPTPAVSGYPKDRAVEFISSTEQFDRAYYAGYLGFMNSAEANLYVNLRCMRIGEHQIEMFAGAGITAESDPEDEYQETEEKLKTLLDPLRA